MASLPETFREGVNLAHSVDAAVGPDWPYGITIQQRETSTGQIWRAYDPGSRDVKAESDTEPPAVTVYDRSAYESACVALGVPPVGDADVWERTDHRDVDFTRPDSTPRDEVALLAQQRRWAGLDCERKARARAGYDQAVSESERS